MLTLHLVPKRFSHILVLSSIVTAFLFTACNHSKKQNGEKSTTVNSATTTQQQTPQVSTKKKPKTSGANTTQAKAITAQRGYKIAKSNGCFSCHSTDGSQKAAPTFKNLYDRKTALKNGLSTTADSAYIVQSIEDPDAKIVKGFMAIMPRFSYLKKDQIASIIAYIKSISK